MGWYGVAGVDAGLKQLKVISRAKDGSWKRVPVFIEIIFDSQVGSYCCKHFLASLLFFFDMQESVTRKRCNPYKPLLLLTSLKEKG